MTTTEINQQKLKNYSLLASGIVLTTILNWKIAHIYALSAQVLAGVYAGTSGFFMILLFVK